MDKLKKCLDDFPKKFWRYSSLNTQKTSNFCKTSAKNAWKISVEYLAKFTKEFEFLNKSYEEIFQESIGKISKEFKKKPMKFPMEFRSWISQWLGELTAEFIEESF